MTARLLTLSEVAEHLGVATVIIKRMMRRRKIAFIRVGGALRFKAEDVVEAAAEVKRLLCRPPKSDHAIAKARSRRLQKKYGLTLEDTMRMAASQGRRCAICDAGGRRLVVDHCHSTGRVRGMLCGRCNSALGLMKDEPVRLRRAADYLERNR